MVKMERKEAYMKEVYKNGVQDRVKEHLNEVLTNNSEYKNRWVSITACGSMNYNLFDESSDIDTKLIVFPSVEELCLGKPPISKTYVLVNGEHCDIKDIREYIRICRKANINFLEILASDFYILNDEYSMHWLHLRDDVEYISGNLKNKLIFSSLGMAQQKASKILHDSPTNHEFISKYGYVAKELQHTLRLYEFVKTFLNGNSFEEAIWIPYGETRDIMMNIKRYNVIFPPEIAEKICNTYVKKMKTIIDNTSLRNEKDNLDSLNHKLNIWLEYVMKIYLRNALKGNKYGS